MRSLAAAKVTARTLMSTATQDAPSKLNKRARHSHHSKSPRVAADKNVHHPARAEDCEPVPLPGSDAFRQDMGVYYTDGFEPFGFYASAKICQSFCAFARVITSLPDSHVLRFGLPDQVPPPIRVSSERVADIRCRWPTRQEQSDLCYRELAIDCLDTPTRGPYDQPFLPGRLPPVAEDSRSHE